MEAQYRGWLSDNKRRDVRVLWSASYENNYGWYDFEVSNGEQQLNFYSGTHEQDDIDGFVGELEALRDRIDEFLDAVEEIEQERGT